MTNHFVIQCCISAYCSLQLTQIIELELEHFILSPSDEFKVWSGEEPLGIPMLSFTTSHQGDSEHLFWGPTNSMYVHLTTVDTLERVQLNGKFTFRKFSKIHLLFIVQNNIKYLLTFGHLIK